jgi:catechol 2,3-dioxygenase-like lactoylglutathione lyase family enzyme
MISKLDFVAIPSQDAERSRTFYVDTLGLRADERGRFEFWAGETCFGIWEPERFGMQFSPQKMPTPRFTLTTCRRLAPSSRPRESSSPGRPSIPAFATWRSSPTPTATTSCCIIATRRTAELVRAARRPCGCGRYARLWDAPASTDSGPPEEAPPCARDHPEPVVRHPGRGGRGLLHLRLRELAHPDRHSLHRGRAATSGHGDDRGVRAGRPGIRRPSHSTAAHSSASTRPSPSRSPAKPRSRSTTTGNGCPRVGRKAVRRAQGQVRPFLAGRTDRDAGVAR